jgi:1,2-dihydroxy-3-keto-5-methylthiopentene dioxygenase
MSILTIQSDSGKGPTEVYKNFEHIADKLEDVGILFERWQATADLKPDDGQEEVLKAYEESVNRIKKMYGFQSVDVIGLKPDHPDRAQMRAKFLNEHVHSEFEVRFFVEGSGLFYLHLGDKVYGVLCEKGDLISVPAGTKHWFDMGTAPSFRAIRFFTNQEGWVAQFSGSTIASQFADYEKYWASHK